MNNDIRNILLNKLREKGEEKQRQYPKSKKLQSIIERHSGLINPSHFLKNELRKIDLNSPDNVYYNVVARNVEYDLPWVNTFKFNTMTDEPIIENPYNYYLTIWRFSIPTYFIPEIQVPPQINQLNPNLSEFSVTLEYDGNISQEFIIYVANNTISPPTGTINELDRSNPYYFMFSYQQFLFIMNTALSLAFTNLAAKPVGSLAPYMVYDSNERLFSLICEKAFYDLTLALPIKIYINFPLYKLFTGFPVIFTDLNQGRDIQFDVEDYLNNSYQIPNTSPIFPPTLFEIKQNTPSIPNWSPFKSLIFLSNLLPIKPEYTSLSGDSFIPLLADFEPLKQTSSDLQTNIQFFPQGPLRLVDLQSKSPIYKIDLNIKWIDQYGEPQDIIIPTGDNLSVKIAFLKKSAFNNSIKNTSL